jgi:hypothetical protein
VDSFGNQLGTGTTVGAIAGDYNLNGVVDAADYVAWRKGLGTAFTQANHDVWRAHFGQADGSSSAAIANTPFPNRQACC